MNTEASQRLRSGSRGRLSGVDTIGARVGKLCPCRRGVHDLDPWRTKRSASLLGGKSVTCALLQFFFFF